MEMSGAVVGRAGPNESGWGCGTEGGAKWRWAEAGRVGPNGDGQGCGKEGGAKWKWVGLWQVGWGQMEVGWGVAEAGTKVRGLGAFGGTGGARCRRGLTCPSRMWDTDISPLPALVVRG